MRASKPLIALIALVLAETPAQADVPLNNIECVGATSFEAMEDCSNLQLAKWDKALNIAYKRSMEFLEQHERNFRAQPNSDTSAVPNAERVKHEIEALRQAQRIWIEFRDANCSFYSYNYNGVPAINTARCKTKMTEKRTIELIFGIIGDNPTYDEQLKSLLKEVEPVVGRRLRGSGPQLIN